MGVRFQCPNGHQLHVKAHLAGKRAICPDCGAKFIVPSFNGGRATPAVDSEVAEEPAAAKVRTPPPLPAAPLGGRVGEGNQWYVGSSSGRQFGPASGDVFQQWVDEGRVAGDSWVWRTDWPAWKPAGAALPQLRELQPAGATVVDGPAEGHFSPATVIADDRAVAPQVVDTASINPTLAGRHRRKRRSQNLTFWLMLATVVLAAVLAVVLMR
ncbi:MAG: DUF4339 domain-containing protein [Planctomycetota bacterium]